MRVWREILGYAAAGFLIGLILGLLTGCGAPESGRVIDKRYEEPRTETYYTSQCVAYDSKTGGCTVSIPVEQHSYDDEDWKLLLENEKGNRGWREVTHPEYDATQIGDWYGEGGSAG